MCRQRKDTGKSLEARREHPGWIVLLVVEKPWSQGEEVIKAGHRTVHSGAQLSTARSSRLGGGQPLLQGLAPLGTPSDSGSSLNVFYTCGD